MGPLDFQAKGPKDLVVGVPLTTDYVQGAVQKLVEQHLGPAPEVQVKPDVHALAGDVFQVKKMLGALVGAAQVYLNPQALADLQKWAEGVAQPDDRRLGEAAAALKAMKEQAQARGVPAIGEPFGQVGKPPLSS